MAYNGFYDGQPQYYYYYPSPAPVTFPSASYVDDRYRQDFRRQGDLRDQSRHGLMPTEQVFGRADAGVPWWLSSDHPHAGGYHLGRRPDDRSTVEMYVPLCCDECERKVRRHLEDMEGVESVSADQWEKKVVVQGYNLHPRFLLRRIQRDKPNSAFWSDRPR